MPVRSIWKEHHVRRGQRTGVCERREPYLYGDGSYRVADLTLGKGANKDENAVKVSTLDEVAGYVRRGFAVRMRSGMGKASLNCADGMVIED